MRLPQGFEWLIIGAIILLLFGAKRLPDAARGLGRSLRIFKAETKNLTGDHDDDENTADTAPVAPVVATPVITGPVLVVDEPVLTPAPSVNHRSEA